jgi:hypothetical protein
VCAGCDNVSCVDTSEGNAVDFEGTGNEEDALVKVVDEDNALATETTGEEDEDGTRLKRLSEFCRTDGFADLRGDLLVIILASKLWFLFMQLQCILSITFLPPLARVSILKAMWEMPSPKLEMHPQPSHRQSAMRE